MPDHQPTDQAGTIGEKAHIQSPGIHLPAARQQPRQAGPLRITWAARWEHDKAPEILHQALRILAAGGVDFRLSVLGQSFRQTPGTFGQMQQEFSAQIDQWGYLESHQQYLQALQQTDIFVSTARHEFFGISVVEAIGAGASPLVPRSLAYPDVLQLEDHPEREKFFYDGSPADLADRLSQLAACIPSSLDPCLLSLRESTERFDWPVRAAEMDAMLGQLAAPPV
jgi:glycosyltransferase involved in cell wall biosynthesis